ncbi:MAG: hypothetical protein IJB27_05985 [Clostridia bacterium]|nr:hypothetical protein [Clostridia bacterium]
MATFEEMILRARDAAYTTEKKTTEFVNKTRVKLEIAQLQKQQAAIFEGVGRLEYDAAESGEDITALKAEAFETVRDLQKKIDKCHDRLYSMSGAVRCKDCAAVNDGDAVFCKKCGKTL